MARPKACPPKRITVLVDRSAGKLVVSTRFGSEDDLKKGAETLEGMSPPESSNIRRVSVDVYEVALDRATSRHVPVFVGNVAQGHDDALSIPRALAETRDAAAGSPAG